MKKLAISTLLVAGIVVSTSASAFWNDNNYNECWGNPFNCNPYDPWDPRYWMEEMEDAFDDDEHYGYGYPPPYGFGGYAPGYQHGPYGRPYMPYPPYYGPQMAPRGPWVRPAPVAPKQQRPVPPHHPQAKAPAVPLAKAIPQYGGAPKADETK